MPEPSPQRAYRAPCPGCGAPVEFRSAQSTHAVCSYCHSTIVREGEQLRRLGRMAEIFADYSPLQLLAAGRWHNRGFTVVGRLQYKYGDTTWSEWQLAFDDGTGGTLSEDNGSFVVTRPLEPGRALPEAAQLRLGATTAIQGKRYSVTFNEPVALISAEGELGHLPEPGRPAPMVEMRSEDGQVLAIDYAQVPPAVSAGRAVQLEQLSLTGLRAESAKEDKGRAFSCPNCGAPVQVTLAQSKSIVCASCNSVIDLSSGVGGELRHAEQHEPVRPLIALGRSGRLQNAEWQVVGFQHRMGQEPGDDEQFGWSEYLLFNRQRGFTFLVDAEDGWSLVKPTTGAPTYAQGSQSATYLGMRYTQRYAYNAETTYVAGEFYWPVERGHKTFNRDFAAGRNLLSMEQTPREVTWSAGTRIEGDTVAKAFGLEARRAQFARVDSTPFSPASGTSIGMIVFWVVLMLVLFGGLRACDRCDPRTENCSGSSYRSSGGAWGGFSTGGGHK